MAWTDTINAIAAAASAVAAGAAWRAARHSNQTADAVARIEAERRHLERTPQIDLTFEDGESQARLHLYLNGPDELRALDSVTVAVDNDDRDPIGPHFFEHHGGPTREQLERFVWGPFRFSPGINEADRDGRMIPGFPLVVGKGRPLAMERTRPGSWMGSTTYEIWQLQNVDNPIRLRITCRLGEEEWVLTKRIPNPPIPTP